MQGLTVELHPFQRQALRFMLDNEHRSGGHRDCFWYELSQNSCHASRQKATTAPHKMPVKIMKSAAYASCVPQHNLHHTYN